MHLVPLLAPDSSEVVNVAAEPGICQMDMAIFKSFKFG